MRLNEITRNKRLENEARAKWGTKGSIYNKEGRCKKCINWEDGFDPRPKTYGDLCQHCDGFGNDPIVGSGLTYKDTSALWGDTSKKRTYQYEIV